MKITVHEKRTEFKNIALGDIFEFEENHYMRIHNVRDVICGGVVNAILLRDGEGEYFPDDTLVYLRNAELIVE